jgi:hypothetical protein
MATFAAQLGLLTFLFAGFTAVLAPLATLGHHAAAGWVRAFLWSVRHVPPPGANLTALAELSGIRLYHLISAGTAKLTGKERTGR